MLLAWLLCLGRHVAGQEHAGKSTMARARELARPEQASMLTRMDGLQPWPIASRVLHLASICRAGTPEALVEARLED